MTGTGLYHKLQPTLKITVWSLVCVIFLTFTSSFFYRLVFIVGFLHAIPFVSWMLMRIVKKYLLNRNLPITSQKAILITGCDSGFGHQLAKKLYDDGYTVFAGCLFPEGDGAGSLKKDTNDRMKIVKLDVTKKEDVEKVVNEIRASRLDLWGLVNNAGIALYLPLEFGQDLDDLEKIMSVNVNGVVRVTKHCLPLIRKCKGRIINVASIMGRISFTGLGAYCMSKYAVRAFSDCLRREMYQFGVKVVTIEPMMYSTNIMNNDIIMGNIDKMYTQTSCEVREAYGSNFLERFKKRAYVSLKTCRPETYEVVDAMRKGLTLEDPDVFYRCCGQGERPALWFMTALPDLVQDMILTGKNWRRMLKVFENQTLKKKQNAPMNNNTIHVNQKKRVK